jgi:hypothetical protein
MTEVNLKSLQFNERERICDEACQDIFCLLYCQNQKLTQYISYLQSKETKSLYEMTEKQGDKEILLILGLFNPSKPSAYYMYYQA